MADAIIALTANRAMKSAFLAPDSRVVDTCGGHSCYAHGFLPSPG